jgi:uncharacterized protein involved in type VI secretion and phage assembly
MMVKPFQGDDIDPFNGAEEVGVKPAPEKEEAKEEPKAQRFGDAFKQARKSGLKTFEWNGKKYTTETAEEKAARKTAAPKPSALSVSKADGSFSDRQEYKRAVKDRQKEQQRKAMGMKSGGMVKSSASKRGDGCAQRGHTKGRMV